MTVVGGLRSGGRFHNGHEARTQLWNRTQAERALGRAATMIIRDKFASSRHVSLYFTEVLLPAGGSAVLGGVRGCREARQRGRTAQRGRGKRPPGPGGPSGVPRNMLPEPAAAQVRSLRRGLEGLPAPLPQQTRSVLVPPPVGGSGGEPLSHGGGVGGLVRGLRQMIVGRTLAEEQAAAGIVGAGSSSVHQRRAGPRKES